MTAKILLVEDNEDNRDSMTRLLTRRGYEIFGAADGSAGVAMAKTVKPDLILMDMNMPVLDGWDAVRQIRATEELKNIPIVALTAYILPDDRAHALSVGCTEYHTKPIDFPTLLIQIDELLAGARPIPPKRMVAD